VESYSAVAVTANQGRVCESTYTLKRESLGANDKKAIAGDGTKVFGVCWDKEVGIVSCGEDKRVQVNQSIDLARGLSMLSSTTHGPK